MQPVLYEVPAFDGASPFLFTFAYSGNQVFKNRLIIRNNESNVVVYDHTVSSFQLEHSLPPKSLVNGVCYNARIQVYDHEDQASEFSNPIIFYCFTTPIWIFANLEANQIIHNSSYELRLTYSQPEGELLNSYQVFLYDFGYKEIFHTGVRYHTESLTATISGLADNTPYYVRAKAETVNHMQLDTGSIPISAEYVRPSFFAVVNLENIAAQGSIKIQSNIISILGSSNPDPPKFIDNEKVDLRKDNAWVKFDKGFSIDSDFTLQIIAQELSPYTEFLIMENDKHKLVLSYRQAKFDGETEQKDYVELRAYNGITSYVLLSNLLSSAFPADRIYIWLRRIGCVYELKIERLV